MLLVETIWFFLVISGFIELNFLQLNSAKSLMVFSYPEPLLLCL